MCSNINRKAVFCILNNFRRSIARALLSLSERASGSSLRSQITPKSKFAIAAATLSNLIGFTRGDSFYRCEYDLDEIKRAADTEPYLRIAIRKYTELFTKAGYVFKSQNDEAVEYLKKRFRIMDYMTDQPFDLLIRETAYDLIKFSNAFWIKSRADKIPFVKASGITKSEKPVSGYYRVDPDQMRIKFDKDGNISGYKQVTPSNREKEFDKDDVIHFVFDRDPGSVWGVPRWIAVLEDIRVLRKIEGNSMAMIYRYAIPMVQAQVGLPQAGLFGTKKEIEETKSVIERTPPDGLLVTGPNVNLKMVGAEGQALDINPFLSYFENRVFTGLNTSQSMMGRGGTQQDADSMDEQVHNAVKDNQAVFALQFKHEVITELLIEGGFDPINNEEDIVDLVFNEINLDTKVKLENHIANLFQSNVITFDETRTALGYRNDDVDQDNLYANMIQQSNEIEQINLNHENAMELAKLSASLNAANTQEKGTAPKTTNDSQKQQSSYTKKNTGNGKVKGTGTANKAIKTNDSPKNQHGTFSAKIKESEDTVIDVLSENLTDDGSNLQELQKQIRVYIDDVSRAASKNGAKKAFEDLNIEEESSIAPQNETLNLFINNSLSSCFSDIKERFGNTTDRNSFKNIFESQKYRLKYLTDFVSRKSYWYSYMKVCGSHGIDHVIVRCADTSRHKDNHSGKVLDTRTSTLKDIPAYSANCQCYLEPYTESKI